MTRVPPAIIPHILSQHAEEAAFLWLLRDDAATNTHYDLNEFYGLENHLEAHIDGLRFAEQPGWELVLGNLQQSPVPSEIFTTATLTFKSSNLKNTHKVKGSTTH